MSSNGSALVFSIILMAAITILGLAAFTLLYNNHLEVIRKNDTYFNELEEHVIAQEIYVNIVLDSLVLTGTGTYTITVDGTDYTLAYDSGEALYDTGHISVVIDDTYKIISWQIDFNQEE
jgi:hypothetical protein